VATWHWLVDISKGVIAITLGLMHVEEEKWVLKDKSKYLSNNEMMLEDIVNTNILNTIHDKFIQVTGVRGFITNSRGKPLTDIISFTKFCKVIRSHPEGRRRCEECYLTQTQEAKRKGTAIYYTCHAGLICAVSSIMVHNQHMGSFVCGQVVWAGENLDFDDIKSKFSDLNLDERQLRICFNEVEVVSQKKLVTALEMLTLMTNYIMEMGVANITQQQLMTEMKAKAELEDLLKETEYKALQAQVNPHFLFNCLNTIGRVALLEGASQTQELIYAISDILRSLLKHPERIITVREELKYVKDYLAIQQARFSDRIHVIYNVDQEIMEAKLPKFTLQPLVENAIVHGLEPKIDGGDLAINAKKNGENIILSIIDTGVGIPVSKLNNLLEFQSNSDKTENVTAIGMKNVHQRIQSYFGPNYGLKVDSQQGRGCQVTVTLPFVRAC
jgi:two-component system LytT family sensor kinase